MMCLHLFYYVVLLCQIMCDSILNDITSQLLKCTQPTNTSTLYTTSDRKSGGKAKMTLRHSAERSDGPQKTATLNVKSDGSVRPNSYTM